MRQSLTALLLVLAAACARSTGPGATPAAPAPSPAASGQGAAPTAAALPPGTVGAADPREAISGFMAAVRAQDLRSMGAIWGTAKGPAREQFKQDELEKRLIVIQCLLNHDKWGFAEDRARLSAGGRQEYLVEVRQGSLTAKTVFTTIAGPSGRWFVEIIDVQPLKEFCR